MRIYVIVILLILTGGFGSGNCLTAQDYSEQVETKELNAAFNSLLTSVKEVSAKKKYPTLQRFLEEHPGYARAYFALFDWYVFDEQLSQAKSYFHTLSTSSPHKQYCQWVLAKIHSLEEKPHAAFNAFVAAIEAGPPPIALIKDFIEFCSSHGQAFNSFEVFQRQNFDEELTSVIEAIQKYNNFEDGEALARIKKLIRGLQEDLTVLHIWGNCSISLSQFSEADSIWQRGLHIAKENENLDFEVQFLSNLGYLNERLSQFDLAHHYYNSAYELARRISSNSQTSSLAARLAFVFRALGDYDNAQAFFKEVIGRQESLAKKQDLAGWYRGYAMTLYYLGKYQESLGFLDKCEELLRNTNFSQRLILAKLDKATVLASLNQIHIAKKNLMEVMEIATTKNLEYYERTARAKLGDLLRQEGKYHEAREFYREFISYLNSNDNLQKLVYPWQVSFANTFFLEERYEEARKEYLKALKFAKETDAKTYQGWSLLHLGYIELILGDATRALEYYDSAREIATKQTNSEMLWKAYVGYGNARKGTGNIFSAISAYQKAAQLFEATRNEFNIDRLRVGYFIDGFQIYQNLVGCYLDLYENNPTESYLDSVFYYHELGRGRGLSELAENEKSESPGEGYGQVKQRIQIVQHALREASHAQDKAGLEDLYLELEAAKYSLVAEQLRAGIETTSSQSSKLPKARSLESVLRYLKRSQLGMLLYHIAEDRSFALASDGSKVKIVSLQVTPDSLTAKVDLLMRPFHGVQQDSLNSVSFRADIAFQLYQTLVAPVESAITLPPNIVIIPDAALLNLPFEMLLTEKQASCKFSPSAYPSYASDFLQNRYSLVYGPATSVLGEKSSRSRNLKTLVFANPFDASRAEGDGGRLRSRVGWRFAPLKYAQREARELAQIDPDAEIFDLNMATEAALMKEASKYDVIHFATHAFVDSVFDDFSGVVLAAGEDSTTDGILNAFEISDLNLDCDLVTLSACETGRGKRVVGEGVLGLPRQFLVAGAKSVLMTHWKVDDRFASILMPEFYRYYLKEGLSKAEALNTAKRVLLRDIEDSGDFYYQHPVYWAAFTLYGDPGVERESPRILYLAALVFLFVSVVVATRLRKSNSSAK